MMPIKSEPQSNNPTRVRDLEQQVAGLVSAGEGFAAYFRSHCKNKTGLAAWDAAVMLVPNKVPTHGPVSSGALSPTVLVDLTRQLLGELDARKMAECLGEIDQPAALKELLAKYLVSLRKDSMRRLVKIGQLEPTSASK